MIGFSGYAFTEPEQPREILARMMARYDVAPESMQREIIVRPNFCLCTIARSGEPMGLLVDDERHLILAVQGQIAPSAMAQQSNRSGIKATAKDLADLYLKGGAEEIARLNGRFAIVIWDELKRDLILITDYFGMRRLCWTRTADAFLFGTEYKSFLDFQCVNTDLDDQAVAEFITIGYPLQDRTLLSNIKVVPANTVLQVKEKSQQPSSSDLCFPEPTGGKSLDRYADHLGEVLDEVISEYASVLEGPLLIPLSGWLDARTILGFAMRSGVDDILTCTFGHRHCYDVRFAQSMAKVIGVEHRYIYLPYDYIDKYATHEIHLTEGEIGARYFYYSMLKSELPAGLTLWSGHLGDVLSGGHVKSQYDLIENEQERFEKLYNQMYHGRWGNRRLWTRNDLIPEVVASNYQGLFADGTKKTVRDLIRKQQGATYFRKALNTEMAQRPRRFSVFQLDSLSRTFDVVAPFVDYRVLEAFFSIPDEYLFEAKAYRRMIARFLPGLASVPDVASLMPVNRFRKKSDLKNTLVAGRKMTERVIPSPLRWRVDRTLNEADRLLAVLSGGWLGNHNRREYTHPDVAIRKHPRLFYEMLGDKNYLEPYFSQSAVRKVLDLHVSGEINADPALYNLLTFATWKKYLSESIDQKDRVST